MQCNEEVFTNVAVICCANNAKKMFKFPFIFVYSFMMEGDI